METKKVWKIVGISLGILALIGTGLYFLLRKKEENNTQYMPEPERVASPSGQYSPEEIKNMQAWLLSEGIRNENQIITHAINSTGGIDGKIGNGFQTALSEAMKQGYIDSLNALYKISNT